MKVRSIRRAGPEDAALLARLGEETFRAAFGEANTSADIDRYVAEAFSESGTRTALEDPSCHFWIAYDGKADAIGYEKLREGTPPHCVHGTKPIEIQRIYATEKAIGIGLGAALMRTALAWAERNEYDSVWLGVWEKNERAIGFYERWGFVTVGDHTFRLGSDDQTDLIMERAL